MTEASQVDIRAILADSRRWISQLFEAKGCNLPDEQIRRLRDRRPLMRDAWLITPGDLDAMLKEVLNIPYPSGPSPFASTISRSPRLIEADVSPRTSVSPGHPVSLITTAAPPPPPSPAPVRFPAFWWHKTRAVWRAAVPEQLLQIMCVPAGAKRTALQRDFPAFFTRDGPAPALLAAAAAAAAEGQRLDRADAPRHCYLSASTDAAVTRPVMVASAPDPSRYGRAETAFPPAIMPCGHVQCARHLGRHLRELRRGGGAPVCPFAECAFPLAYRACGHDVMATNVNGADSAGQAMTPRVAMTLAPARLAEAAPLTVPEGGWVPDVCGPCEEEVVKYVAFARVTGAFREAHGWPDKEMRAVGNPCRREMLAVIKDVFRVYRELREVRGDRW